VGSESWGILMIAKTEISQLFKASYTSQVGVYPFNRVVLGLGKN